MASVKVGTETQYSQNQIEWIYIQNRSEVMDIISVNEGIRRNVEWRCQEQIEAEMNTCKCQGSMCICVWVFIYVDGKCKGRGKFENISGIERVRTTNFTELYPSFFFFSN